MERIDNSHSSLSAKFREEMKINESQDYIFVSSKLYCFTVLVEL